MTEQEWQTANARDVLLLHLTAAASDRKLRSENRCQSTEASASGK
jgi:hypothetical protein